MASDKAIQDLYKVDLAKGGDITGLQKGISKGGQGSFDKIYKTKDGRIIVVEAKGGASKLGVRGTAEQGSKEYFESIIESLAGDKRNKPLLEEMKLALKNGELDYVKVQQGFNNKGKLVDTDFMKFDITGAKINLGKR